MNIIYLRSLMLCSYLLISTLASASERPNLSEWLNKALAQHPELQSAQSAVDEAKALTRGAQQPLFNPELEFEFEKTDVETKTAGISQTIDWGDKQSAQMLIAQQELVARQSTLDFRQQEIANELLSALAEYLTSKNISQVAQKREELMTQFIRVAKRRHAAGDLSQIELDLAQLAYAEARFSLANAKANEITSQQALYGLLGIEGNQRNQALPEFPSVPDAAEYPVADQELLLDNLPAMHLARSQMEISRAEVLLRQREQRPDPTIGISAGREGDENLTGISLSIPLFVRNNFSAEVDAANARLIQSQQEALSVRRSLTAQLTASALAFRINREAWLQWQSAGNQSLLQQGKLLDRLWRAGELSTTDYLVQLKQSLDTEASAIEQQGHLWQSWTQWLIASGDIAGWIQADTPIKNVISQRNNAGEKE